MFKVFENEGRLKDLLNKKELLLLMILKYKALLMIDELYTRFFRESKSRFENAIVAKMVD